MDKLSKQFIEMGATSIHEPQDRLWNQRTELIANLNTLKIFYGGG